RDDVRAGSVVDGGDRSAGDGYGAVGRHRSGDGAADPLWLRRRIDDGSVMTSNRGGQQHNRGQETQPHAYTPQPECVQSVVQRGGRRGSAYERVQGSSRRSSEIHRVLTAPRSTLRPPCVIFETRRMA